MEEPESVGEQAVLLIERARDSKAPAARAQHLAQALQKLSALPDAPPPKPSGACLAVDNKGCSASCCDPHSCNIIRGPDPEPSQDMLCFSRCHMSCHAAVSLQIHRPVSCWDCMVETCVGILGDLPSLHGSFRSSPLAGKLLHGAGLSACSAYGRCQLR